MLGYWATSQSIVQVSNCNKQLCATIEHIFVDEGVDPKSILDTNNRNKSLRDRTLVGINLLENFDMVTRDITCLLYTSPSPRDATLSRMPSSA